MQTLREVKFILWNNKDSLIEGKTVFYRHYFNNGVNFTKDLLFDKTNTESFNEMKKRGLTNTNFLVWTGLRQSFPPNLRSNIPDFEEVIDIQNYKCRNYYCLLIKLKYERPKKWDKLGHEFDLREDHLLPLRVASEPYVRSFQFKVLNFILYPNDRLLKIGYVSNPNSTFCQVS